MRRRLAPLLLLLPLILVTSGCPSVARSSYNTIVGSKAFLDSVKKAHPECPSSTTKVCQLLAQATSAKDALIDATEAYCAGPSFSAGGACNEPVKGTPAATQALAKLQAALSNYNQIATDLKGVL